MRPDAGARAGMVLVALLWGLNWPSAKFVLEGFSPWSFRAISYGLGTLLLMGFARGRGISLRIPPGRPRLHVAVAGLLNIGGFGIFSAFAQLGTTTSRTAICAYTMSIWATLLARPILSERFDAWRGAALAIGAAGLLVLLRPLFAAGLPAGVLFALGAALSWAAGTVYLKWARIGAHPVALAAWQLATGTAAVAAGFVLAGPEPGPVRLVPSLALVYSTAIGTAIAYVLWFQSVARLPAATAGLGTLLVPVVGVIASAILLGDRPSGADLEGFGLIFAAGVCALGPFRLSGRAD